MPRGENAMEAAQEMSGQEKENLAGDVMDSLGTSDVESPHESEFASEGDGNHAHAVNHAQKRINARNRERDRQLQYLQQKIADMESRMAQTQQPEQHQPMNPYSEPHATGNSAVDEHIHRAISAALQHKEMEERKAKEAEHMSHVQKQYHELNKHLDGLADKYDDFDEVVRGDDMPYTAHMRDAALLLPHTGEGSAGEVLYKLGKNPEELRRISKLHPLEQAREINKLSHALIKGAEQRSAQQPQTMGNIKSNPARNTSHAVTEKTSPSEIRARMKAGKFK